MTEPLRPKRVVGKSALNKVAFAHCIRSLILVYYVLLSRRCLSVKLKGRVMLRTPLWRRALGRDVCDLRDVVLPRAVPSAVIRSSRNSTRRCGISKRAVGPGGLAVTVLLLISMSSIHAAETCTPALATVVSVQGSVE